MLILASAAAALLAVSGAYRLGWIGPADTRARMQRPANGDREFNAGSPFVWTAVSDARAYRLRLRTVFGSASVFDSGVIHVTRCLVPSLPAKRWLAGTLGTQIGTEWRTVSFFFRPAGSPAASAGWVETALWATDFVRMMANSENRPRPGTPLEDVVRKNGRIAANCLDYSETLIQVLREVRIPSGGHFLNVAFNSNGYDGHTLVELFDSASRRWILLDPTFDLSIVRDDGTWASAEDVSEAIRAKNWRKISYRFLGRKGDRLARGYYIDYPLLLLNVYHEGDPFCQGKGHSPLPFLEQESFPYVGHAPAMVLLQSTVLPRVVAFVGGNQMTLDCDGIDGTSKLFSTSSVVLEPGEVGKVFLYRARRYVF